MRVDGPSAAALAAREEPPVNCPEDEWHTRAEHEHGLHNETPVAACPLCDPLITGIAAREDIERPERCWTLVSGEEGELPVVEAGPMLVREEVRVREDTERPDELARLREGLEFREFLRERQQIAS